MAAIAAFAKSDQGRFYAALSDRFGVDPALGFSDDVVAVNLRAALFRALTQDVEKEEEGPTLATNWREREDWEF